MTTEERARAALEKVAADILLTRGEVAHLWKLLEAALRADGSKEEKRDGT